MRNTVRISWRRDVSERHQKGGEDRRGVDRATKTGRAAGRVRKWPKQSLHPSRTANSIQGQQKIRSNRWVRISRFPKLSPDSNPWRRPNRDPWYFFFNLIERKRPDRRLDQDTIGIVYQEKIMTYPALRLNTRFVSSFSLWIWGSRMDRSMLWNLHPKREKMKRKKSTERAYKWAFCRTCDKFAVFYAKHLVCLSSFTMKKRSQGFMWQV